jgi:hypothetical protein
MSAISFPDEILFNIAWNTSDVKTLCLMTQLSKVCHVMFNDPSLWHKKLLDQYPYSFVRDFSFEKKRNDEISLIFKLSLSPEHFKEQNPLRIKFDNLIQEKQIQKICSSTDKDGVDKKSNYNQIIANFKSINEEIETIANFFKYYSDLEKTHKLIKEILPLFENFNSNRDRIIIDVNKIAPDIRFLVNQDNLNETELNEDSIATLIDIFIPQSDPNSPVASNALEHFLNQYCIRFSNRMEEIKYSLPISIHEIKKTIKNNILGD